MSYIMPVTGSGPNQTVTVSDHEDAINAAISEAVGDEASDRSAQIAALAEQLAELPDSIDLPSFRKVAVDHLVHRPGDAPEHFGLQGGVVVTNADGKAVRLDDSRTITASPRVALEPGRRFEARFSYRRASAIPDPANDAVACGIIWYSAAGAEIGSTMVNTDVTLTVASGRREVSVIAARTAEPGITVIAPGAARYAAAFVRVFGTDHTTDVEICSLERLPGNLLPGPVGPVGPRGPVGLTGTRGPRGFDGEKGDPGNYLGLGLIGASDDIADRPVSAANGDAWGLVGDGTVRIYIYSGGAWFDAGPITSPESFPVANTIYVQEFGSNANSGSSWGNAVLSIERALELADLRGEPTLIEWGPGVYDTQGHLDMPDDTVIRAAHRSVFVRPSDGFEEQNVFRMGSGCFIEGPMFEGWRLDSLINPTEGFAVSFRPGAVIRRVPYAHKIAIRTLPTWGLVPPPLDRANGNPFVGRGGGVALADGLVCSQYSTFANIMTWGATPVSPNGIGYCAKNGGLINAVNAVSMWAHKHFLAKSGGQMILSGCSTQFGDFTMHADGYREIVRPGAIATVLSVLADDADLIEANSAAIIDAMWAALVADDYTTGWTSSDETYTRSDAALFLRALRWVLEAANQKPVQDFASGLFNTIGETVFSPDKLAAFVFSFVHMRDSINALVSAPAQTIVTAAVDALNTTLAAPVKVREVSRITAIGHTWTGTMAGVALTKIPPAVPTASIQDSILETNEGTVVATGQDDYGNALLARGPNGSLEVDAVMGLSGALFEDAVRQKAIEAAIIGSF